MKALSDVSPTAEQLALFSRLTPGVEIIRGAAGSGKTTTALLKLRAAVGFYMNRWKRRVDKSTPIRVLILTFNRTLRGYIAELAQKQIAESDQLQLEISTFSSWAKARTGHSSDEILDPKAADAILSRFAEGLKLPTDFVLDEVHYILGKFLPNELDAYLSSRRDGRGNTPRMEKATREILLDEVVRPYIEYKFENKLVDFNDMAAELAVRPEATYDVVVVDETQDFSANEVRAILAQLAREHTVTFVLDSAQRIYARSFTWQEVGVTVRPENSFKLSGNYRNTKEIAKFAGALMQGLAYDDNGTIPNFENATRSGPQPIILQGLYKAQVRYSLDFIRKNVRLDEQSVAFLHMKGGGWFKYLRQELSNAALPFVDIAQKSDWPAGHENIALSTLHSAKGLEFDYVFIIGLNGEVSNVDGVEDDGTDDERAARVRRLVAMAVGRARQGVVLGYATDDEPKIAAYFQPELCEMVKV